MSNAISVFVKNQSLEIKVTGGETLLHAQAGLTEPLGFVPVCAYVNNKPESLNYPVYSPKTVQYLPVTSAAGNRAYIRSLCMLLYAAVYHTLPGATLRVEHSVSGGYYCQILPADGDALSDAQIVALERHMRETVEADVTFHRHEERTTEVAALFRRQGLTDKVTLLETLHEPYTVYYTLGEVADTYYGPLVPSTATLRVFSLQRFGEGLLLCGPSAKYPDTVAPTSYQPKMFEAFTDYVAFNRILGITNVGEMNEQIQRGESRNIVNLSEALLGNRIASISDEIARRHRAGGARVVMIAGPSSSGKTTFTKRLAIQLMANLLRPKLISLDDYFVDREHTPREPSGEYDYESLYALDLEQFNADMSALLGGGEVELPYYNFSTGRREYRGNRIRLHSDEVLLIEGIHGLNPELSAGVAENMKYRIYVSALTTISIDNHNWVPTTDNRLLRRMIRDAKYRGVTPLDTIRRWPSVRRGEEKWIFPYQENADVMFNSALLYELSVLKERGEQLLRQVPHDEPEYADAWRLRVLLGCFHHISIDAVPSTSILREFLGGSSFKY